MNSRKIGAMTQEQWRRKLAGKLPDRALAYCYALWKEDPFELLIARSRSTKFGDFRYRPDQKVQRISINHDLNPYQFLITLIHEIAHHRVFRDYEQWGIRPHGPEWKRSFRELMAPLLDSSVFPHDILIPLRLHMVNPKASTGGDYFLFKELKKYDIIRKEAGGVLLGDLKQGSFFGLKRRVFEKLETRRSRVLCRERATGRKYLISRHAEVVLVDGAEDLPF
ncbi:SprT-like domain-containing protein [Cyclobacterium xiamenense]|uniref:SprT-like domain-containing protein n=1 Tax=Cyclobacterium xiamenense TaxID=1297121 RepID=UPI0035D119C8